MGKYWLCLGSSGALWLALIVLAGCAGPEKEPVYLDPARPIAERVEDLLSRMTLEEKIGQLNMPSPGAQQLEVQEGVQVWLIPELIKGSHKENLGPVGGFFSLSNRLRLTSPDVQARSINRLQQWTVDSTRLKIPLLMIEEGTHGLMVSGATIFPEGPAIGSSWNMNLVREVYAAAAAEARAIGIHQLCTLVIEPIRDPRLGRNQEAYSEDPYLTSQIAAAVVEGVQGQSISAPDKAIATLCHYPGQSQPVSGLERGAMEISERTLREVYLPGWKAGVNRAGALGVMVTYPAIDGVPAHGSRRLLTDILRGELGFEGIVLGEGAGFGTLVYEGVAGEQRDAGLLALEAGVDVSIWFEEAYRDKLFQAAGQGLVQESSIDRALRRILRLKFQLGLFENRLVDTRNAAKKVHTPENVELALRAAREGIVLLKNEGPLLPLNRDKIRRIAVIGPNADHERNQLGDYVTATVTQEVVTVLEGIEEKLGAGRVEYVQGCEVTGEGLNEISRAVQAASRSDVAVVVLGENEWMTPGGQGTVGEGYDSAKLELTGLQNELVRAISAAGAPVVVVLINGRPLAINWIAQNVPAVVEAWIPGEMGGRAVADVLFGDYNPSGKLTVSFPRHAGQLPVYYNKKRSWQYWVNNGWGKAYVDLEPDPLYVFGHGLSYTTFEYSNPKLEPFYASQTDTIRISVEVKNTGARAGAEIVQLYLQDFITSVATPSRQLRGFERVELAPGEQKTVSFRLAPDQFALLDRNLEWKVEPGSFAVQIGSSSQDIRWEPQFQIRKPQ